MSLVAPPEEVEDKYACTCAAERIATSLYHAPGCPKPKSSFSETKQRAAYECEHGYWRWACALCTGDSE